MSTTRSFVALTILWSACSGSITGSIDSNDGTGGEDSTGDDGGGGGPGGGNGGDGENLCLADAPAFVGPAPITRLTTAQYQNTLRSLFSTVTVGELLPFKEIRRAGG